MDDSTTVHQMAKMLQTKSPITVITNVLTLINELKGVRGVQLVALGGTFHNWCSAFMGSVTTEAIQQLRADVVFISSASVMDGMCFHQSEESVATKRAMLSVAAKKILLVDHTKFDRRALHALASLDQFDHVIVDSETKPEHVEKMRSQGIDVVIAPN
jgi:DeoR/GlpR family transcriptional regulator of sugar metabolism